MTISDVISGEEVTSFVEHLITQKEPVVAGNTIVLPGLKGDVEITLSESCGEVEVVKEVFHNHRGKDEDVWVISFPVTVTEKTGNCQICCNYIENV